MKIIIQVGNLECRKETNYHEPEAKAYYSVLCKEGEGGYVVLYIVLHANGDPPSYETIGERPWETDEPVWPFARSCAKILHTLQEEMRNENGKKRSD